MRWKELRDKWRTPKALTIALTENAELKRQLENLKRSIPALQDAEQNPISTLLSPLQLEALTLAKDLRDFNAAYPFPDLPEVEFEMEQESQRRLIDRRADEHRKWGQKLLHAYANRGFGPRITALMHRLGEELEYPAYVPNYAEDLRVPMKDTIPKLAQQMEMIAIWISRKERGEVNLLK